MKITKQERQSIKLDPQFEYLRDRIISKDQYGYYFVSLRDLGNVQLFSKDAQRALHLFVKGCCINRSYEVIDHINQDKSDNRSINLRIASKSENAVNTLKNTSTKGNKFKGYYFCEKKKGYVQNSSFSREINLYHVSATEDIAGSVYDFLVVHSLYGDTYTRQNPSLILGEIESVNIASLHKNKDLNHAVVVYERTSSRGSNKGLRGYRVDVYIDGKRFCKRFRKYATIAKGVVEFVFNTYKVNCINLKENNMTTTIERANFN